jgi:acylphosphatase
MVTEPVRLSAWERGRVQGVGMRWWIRSRALELGLSGWARNLSDGRVEVVAEGPRAACESLLALLEGALDDVGSPAASPARPGRIDGVVARWSDLGGRGPLAGGFAER